MYDDITMWKRVPQARQASMHHVMMLGQHLPQQHILGFVINLYNYILFKKDMQLVINELLNPCRFTHLVAKDVQLQSPILLMIRINFFL
jgi:hypothetical protein